MRSALAPLVEPLRSLFFPAHCAGCGSAVGEHDDLCAGCAAAVEFVRPPRCGVCSQPYSGDMAEFTCPNCRGEAFAFDCAVAVTLSRGPVRDMVHRLKYARELWLARVLGTLMARGLDDERLAGMEFDGIVPVPLHPRREREREFNQAALLAAELSRASGIPLVAALARRRYTTTQTRLDREGRRQNLRDAFILRKNARVTDNNLLLVDDVLTTGSTLDACAAILLEAGACSVRALTVARG